MKQRSFLRRMMRRAVLLGVIFVLLSSLAIGALRWVNPPISAFMLQHWVSARLAGAQRPVLRYEWVSWESIAPALKLAVIAAEDQRFPTHHGLDLVEMRNAWKGFRRGEPLRGASTISQQTVKNLFLWGGRDYVRKVLEAWLAVLMEGLLSKQRILELYLNVAQFSEDTFGVGAASWRYFDRPPIAIGRAQAARMAAVLPNPKIHRIDRPSSSVNQRAGWILQQMHQLGGTAYLDALRR